MILTPTQSEVVRNKARFRVVNCGRRWGKTTLAIEEMKGIALKGKTRIAYFATTNQQARDIAWLQLVDELRTITVKKNETRMELEVKNLGGTTSLIKLRGWENINTARGQYFDFIVLDEVAQLKNFWYYFQEVLLPTLMDRKGQALFLSTPLGYNHFYDLYNLQLKDNNFQSFRFTTYDNPYIARSETENLRNIMTAEKFDQEIMAEFRKMEGLVYKEFDREKHLFDDKTERKPAIYSYDGVDFGFTNPTAILHVEEDTDGCFWVTKEWYKTGQTTRDIISILQAFNANEIYPDPEDPEKIKEMKDAGLNVQEVIKGKDSIELGIDKVRQLLKQGRLKIHKDCLNTISEIETYHYEETSGEKNEKEKPLAFKNHAMDALRYVIMMRVKSVGFDSKKIDNEDFEIYSSQTYK